MKLIVKAKLHWHKDKWMEKGEYVLYPRDMSCCGPEYVPIKDIATEVDIDDNFDPRPIQVATLREKKKELRAEVQQKLNNIDEQINKLLAIENKVTAE